MREFEATFPAGLLQIAEEELRAVHSALKADIHLLNQAQALIRFNSSLELNALKEAKTVGAIYQMIHFAVPRPKALLGHQHLTELLTQLQRIVAHDSFHSFRIEAAGSNSSVFERLKVELSDRLGLRCDNENGELKLRVIKGKVGWDVLARITPAPLSKRSWRVQDMPGALNACIAAALLRRTIESDTTGTLCNLTCGSGTLLIEGGQLAPGLELIGVEKSDKVVSLLEQNLTAAKVEVQIIKGDAAATGLPANSADYVVSDLPWGERIGERASNQEFYAAILKETARLLLKNGRASFLTQDQKALEKALKGQTDLQIEESFRVFQGGYHPTITILKKI